MGSISSMVRNVAIIIFAGAMIWLRRADGISSDDKLLYTVVGIGVFILLFVIPSYYISTRVASNAPTNRSYDVSEQGHLPSNSGAQQMIAALNRMEFTRLGEIGTKVSGMGEGITWLLGNPSRTILVEVVETQNGLCQFMTIYEDLATIETSYPIGENINKPNYYSRKNTQSVDDAYKFHVKEAKALTTKHGRPRPIKSIESYLKWEKVYRERYVKYKVTSQGALNSVLMFIFILVVMAAIVFWLRV